MHDFWSLHAAVSMECFPNHLPSSAERKTAAFGEEMLLFYPAISPISKQPKPCAFGPYRNSVTVGHGRNTGLPDYKVLVVV
jgi:hypothetical protein